MHTPFTNNTTSMCTTKGENNGLTIYKACLFTLQTVTQAQTRIGTAVAIQLVPKPKSIHKQNVSHGHMWYGQGHCEGNAFMALLSMTDATWLHQNSSTYYMPSPTAGTSNKWMTYIYV